MPPKKKKYKKDPSAFVLPHHLVGFHLKHSFMLNNLSKLRSLNSEHSSLKYVLKMSEEKETCPVKQKKNMSVLNVESKQTNKLQSGYAPKESPKTKYIPASRYPDICSMAATNMLFVALFFRCNDCKI